METLIELLTTAGGFLVGIWPVMFIVLLFGIFKRQDGRETALRSSIKALVVSWVFIAVLRLVFNYFALSTFQLIPEPANSKYFLLSGIFLMPLALAVTLEEIRKRRYVRSIEDMQLLSPSEFEELVARIYRDQGNRVEVVGSTGDHGVDLIVHTRSGETVLVQCKKYRGKVGEPIVRDFYGVLTASQADAGAIVTCGQITPQARLWAEGKSIYLYDGIAFLKIIESTAYRRRLPSEVIRETAASTGKSDVVRPNLQPAVAAAPAAMPVARGMGFPVETVLPDKTPFMNLSNVPDCPSCGTPMILKTTSRLLLKPKKTYICSNAPDCKETFPAD